ncbi:protein SMG7L isoform X2 [Abrus precatorius]|uniref:Protein SMG7L isoform X2 n=1 Tax=Abrus precatorius TaxID=3816 RepID=A0A8B8LX46_ABRPR|nr:protein SMG7L isoform X2 [Abrus precatorius]XP_027360830.1 protein SMG7L isoform X2 [Abrus precatorius]XP_027360840.1 protein SMG7L isoform X2 [Abrus precatorius]XP_027360848.1 protein SMG7L isoform X2 [Abrus precatorius]XP_027360856.1 protein SMG7L isoform X2 [Abrus precatorius]
MTTNLSPSPGFHKEEKVLLEIGTSEKQLWALIHSKGLLHSEVQDLYRKVRSSYERMILNNRTLSELQDVEYSLWKLHYKHIDEFRKIIKKSTGNVDSKKSGMPQNHVGQRDNDNHLRLFKLFLTEAIEFYQTMIVKLRKHYGVPLEALFYKKGWISTSVEPDVRLKCQYLCHRCLVCMGDLARYKQQCENPDIQNHNWSVAATHYLEATRIWPDSGNPQNQLAVLATYIGDEFLALYHCVRSLAVKEPFPDAWNNLILLFEKNRSSPLAYVSSEVCLDFLKPFQNIGEVAKAQRNVDSSNCHKFEGKSNLFTDTKLWSLMVRTISFLFISSSLEDFSGALASTIWELDKMMELDDIELKTMLESYSQMDLARRGPFRAIQVVSILIFSLTNLLDKLGENESEDKNHRQLMQMALTATFSFMGRFIERCLKASSLNHCPLLPSVLVFVEWCSSMHEVYATDQKSIRAISYFFDVFVELLNQLNNDRKENEKLLQRTPLWEDYELRGFVPIACSHLPLDFCGNWEHIDNFESGIELRTERIREAAKKIASRSNDLQKWITCDKLGKQFYVARSDEDHDKKETENVESNCNSTKVKEPNQQTNKDTAEHGKWMTEDNPSSFSTNGKCSVVEDEEVILFRPLTRYNSAPSYPSISTDERMSLKDKDDQSIPSDECLRRATSLLMAQNPAPTPTDPWEFHGSILNFTSEKSFKQQEPSTKESNANSFSETPISAGPPSLNAWVLDRGSLSNNRNNGTNGLGEHRLQPIEEIASSLAGLSINKTENSVTSSVNESSDFHSSSATYSLPVPSAPLLPDNATWFTDARPSLSSPLFQDNSLPKAGYLDWSSTYGQHGYDPRFPVISSGYPPPGRMTSSEWLRWYRENYKPDRANNYMQPTHLNTPVPGNHVNFLYHDTYRFDQFDRWGNPLSSTHYTYMEPPGPPPLQPAFLSAYGAVENKASVYNNFQRPSPYGCGAVTDLRNEPQPLLECLKEKEWQLQRDPNLRGPTFMGN